MPSRAIWAVAAAKLLLHACTSGRGYGFFGDELYYLACADHLDWGYVDHPPFSIWVLAGWRALLGDGLFALRLLPALLGAGAVLCAGLLARELGGGRRAQLLTALVVALAPVHLVVHGYFSMNALDILIWSIACCIVARVVREPTRDRWLALGAVLGVGLLNKLSVLWLGAGLFAALLLPAYRPLLRSPWPWAAGGLAALIFLPHVLWQVANDWPTAEFTRVATQEKMVPVGPVDLFLQQVLVLHPIAFPIWTLGLFTLLRTGGRGPERLFAVVFATTAAILIASGTSRPNYLALAQLPLIAAGALAIERASSGRLHWLAPAYVGVFVVLALALAPLTLPVLPVPQLVAYQRAAGLRPNAMEHSELGVLDQHFADMHGWSEIVVAAAGVWRTLPAEDRARAALLAPDYSIAGAIDRLGRERGLPPAISGHNSYGLWGPRGHDGSVVILLGADPAAYSALWKRIEPAGTWDCGYCMPARNHPTIWIAREPRIPLAQAWSRLRFSR